MEDRPAILGLDDLREVAERWRREVDEVGSQHDWYVREGIDPFDAIAGSSAVFVQEMLAKIAEGRDVVDMLIALYMTGFNVGWSARRDFEELVA